jgi:hypothetical protein
MEEMNTVLESTTSEEPQETAVEEVNETPEGSPAGEEGTKTLPKAVSRALMLPKKR